MITARNDFGQDIEDYDQPFSDPIELLMMWLPPHIDEFRPLMSLATIDENGYPDLRHVLLSSYDQRGITFHVDADSRKVKQLALCAKAAATIAWPQLGKQLIIQGDVEQTSEQEAQAVFLQRNRYLQLLAWINKKPVALKTRQQRQQLWQDFSAQHPQGTLEAPMWWTGYRIKPNRITFWRGQADGPSQRHDYVLRNGNWNVHIIPG